jgi:8-oxo-dGTP pyrophosphatase MutT (NUDIX family)
VTPHETHRPVDPGPPEGGAGVPSANAWVDCACGQRHWGRYGAAGLLLVWRPDAGGGPDVLLQHRAAWTHQGGTWALPGGARGHDESPEQAALREAHEEAGLDPAQVTTGELVVVDHGPWSYTYVLAGTATRAHLEPSDLETEDLAWVPVAEVAAYPLHPLFEQAWPALRHLVSGR